MADVPEGARRDGHAHRIGSEVIVAARGARTLTLFPPAGEPVVFRLDDPRCGVHIPPLWWVELEGYAPDTLTIVISSISFGESNYIRNLYDFFTPGPPPDSVSRTRD